MRAELFRVPDVPFGILAVMPRPRAGDWLADEAASWRKSGLDVVVSLLEDDEVAELGLSAEADECRAVGLAFRRFPILDRGVPPSASDLNELVAGITDDLKRGHGVGVHCRFGVGRSALVAACVLVALGMAVESAWTAVQTARGLTVPDTPEQRAWVAAWAAHRIA